jgi:hypothetical protein
MEKKSPGGWRELESLAEGAGPGDRIAADLRNAPAMLFLQNGRVAIARIEPAPDGNYELARSGRLVVRDGRLGEVTGTPEAPVHRAPSP